MRSFARTAAYCFTACGSGKVHDPSKSRSRPIEADEVVPVRRRRQAILGIAVTTAELDRDRAIRAWLRGEVVKRIGVLGVRLEIALGVIDADRPEAVDRHVLDVQPVDRRLAAARSGMPVAKRRENLGLGARYRNNYLLILLPQAPKDASRRAQLPRGRRNECACAGNSLTEEYPPMTVKGFVRPINVYKVLGTYQELGSELIDYSQKTTAAAMQIAEK